MFRECEESWGGRAKGGTWSLRNREAWGVTRREKNPFHAVFEFSKLRKTERGMNGVKEAHFRTCRVLKALGNPVRYQLFRMLGERDGTSAEFARQLDRNQANVSQHLARLKKLDLISSRRQNRTVIYSLKRSDIHEFVGELEERMVRGTLEDSGPT